MLIPVLTVRDMPEAIAFYTQILDFRLSFAWPDTAPLHAGLMREADEMHLAMRPGAVGHSRCLAILVCADVDTLFATYRSRGLPVANRPESPVHTAPLDQSWGTREVYIDDPSGNTLILQQR